MTSENEQSKPVRRKPNGPRWRSNLVLSILIVVFLIAGIGLWTTQNYLWRFPTLLGQPHNRALIVDELALNYPDPSFVTNTTQALVAGGYNVDYAGPSPNAVDSFRQLPTMGYTLIIIRAHSGGGQSIVTTEPFSSTTHATDQLTGTLAAAEVGSGPLYFALTPKFIRQDMQGRFPGSTVIIMGCAALQGTQDLADAFLDKGANFFIGWDGSVTIIHTDTSTVSLAEQISLGKSVPDATRIAGSADPFYGAKLVSLDWNSLVQSRVNSLLSQAVAWSLIASILVLGPLAVFLVPKFFSLVERTKDRFSHTKRPSRPAKTC